MVNKHSWFLTINNPLDQELEMCRLALLDSTENRIREDLEGNYYGLHEKGLYSNKGLDPKNLAYFGFADEIGKQGTRHLHCIVVFKKAKSFVSVKKLFPRANIQAMRGTLDEAVTYVRKDGKYHCIKFVPIERVATYVDNDNKLARLAAEGDQTLQEHRKEVQELREELREFKTLIASLLSDKKILNRL